jgi:lipopolysaccharide/colanic/teichoic acid biosynthesis glycosyltransferase
MLDNTSSLDAYSGLTDEAALHGTRTKRRIYPYMKRSLDLGALALMAPAAICIVGLLAVAIRFDGGSPFYSQPRLGRGGKVFRLWKLRTMVPDAEQQLERHLVENADARREWDSTQKLKFDPRITWMGRYLRKYSLDELPQLLNVLLGDMSLIGPRPMFPEQRHHYPGTAYFDVRPGLTGLWQVSVRNASSFAERAVHDTRYANNLSFRSDLSILLRTPIVVLKGTGY